MSHWAEVDENNIVLRVVVCDNNDPNGDEGYQWLLNNLGGRWIKTSYNGTIRKRFAGEGMIYDEVMDAFLYPKPQHLPSWIFNEENFDWTPPVPIPDGEGWFWDESKIMYVKPSVLTSGVMPEHISTTIETLP